VPNTAKKEEDLPRDLSEIDGASRTLETAVETQAVRKGLQRDQ